MGPSRARGAVVGQGDTYEAALADVRSAIAFHIETFGAEALSEVQLVIPMSRRATPDAAARWDSRR